MTDPPSNPDSDRHGAEFHRRLDEAVKKIDELQKDENLSTAEVDELSPRESALRYQVGQLQSASPFAADDLISGIQLSCTDLERQIEQIRTVPRR